MSVWRKEFETGHPRVDAEHREVLQRLETLGALIEGNADPREIQQLLATLQQYVLGHFSHEEACMLRVRCPAYQANSRAHAEFTDKFATWVAQCSQPNAPTWLPRQIHREASAWIEAHILNVDCSLRKYPPVATGSSPLPPSR